VTTLVVVGNLQQHIDSAHLGIKHECDICQAGQICLLASTRN
jgi:hypothetical protein